MRKLVLFCLALALAAASVPAMAQSKIDFSGYVKIFHQNLDNFNRAANNNSDTDSFFENKLQINLEIQPNDDISIFWTMRTVNYARWGEFAAGVGGAPAATGLFTRWLYAEVRQPWGTVQIGRLADGLGSNAGGLASLGYTPGWGSEFTYVMPFDIDGPTDSVVYSYDFGNGFVLAAFYAKDNLDRLYVRPNPNSRKDSDRDRFGIEPRYQWDTGGASLGLVYIRDKSFDVQFDIDNTPAFDWRAFSPHSTWELQINPAFVQSWGPFSIHFEGVAGFGKTTFRSVDAVGPNNTFLETEIKNNGLGLYLDASYNYGAGDVTLMSWYVDGTSYSDLDKDRPTLHSSVSLGDFAPFLVAYNGVTLGTGIWTNSLPGDPRFTSIPTNLGISDPGGNALDFGLTNHWGLALLGNHAINDDIRLNYGIGYFRLVSLPAIGFDANGNVRTYPNRSKSLGVEVDLGATFQILDNLSFETKFGYMFNGSAYRNSGYDPGTDAAWYGQKPKDTFAWANVLAVTF
ncbi:MAG: porin [Deltaproteobacteria bacterium]|jgi:hypothetical protein|nr:porin [Deltaproteobacteria bacterium]